MAVNKITIMQPKNIKSMTYDEIANILQIIGGVLLAIGFVVGIATIWVGMQANKEKDIKAREQEETIAGINLKIEQEARKRAEAERALLELQNRLSPRVLASEQKTELLRRLQAIPKGTIEINFVAGNEESMQYAQQFIEIFNTAGWKVEPRALAAGFSILGFGVTLSNPFTQTLEQVFRDCGIQIDREGIPIALDSPDSIALIVGTKK